MVAARPGAKAFVSAKHGDGRGTGARQYKAEGVVKHRQGGSGRRRGRGASCRRVAPLGERVQLGTDHSVHLGLALALVLLPAGREAALPRYGDVAGDRGGCQQNC